MLLFIFGAGASFDSDPARVFSPSDFLSGKDHRPPLAPGLFDPDNAVGKEIVLQFPQAGPLLMRLRTATRQGHDVEEVLERLAAGADDYPGTQRQLVAFRAYLSELMSKVPDKWATECQGLTNYVRALEEADRWNTAIRADQEVESPRV